MATNDETTAERKTIKSMLAGTALGDKLLAKGHTRELEKKEPAKREG
jgi:hypothetical protein